MKGSWIAWIEPSGYIEVVGGNHYYYSYPQPPLGMKWKEGPELKAMLRGDAKQVVRFVESGRVGS